MSAKQTGEVIQLADGDAPSPSLKIGRFDSGLYLQRSSAGVPTKVRRSVAGVDQGDAQYVATAPVDGVAASSTLTSNNTNVANNVTVVIGNKTYTFKTELTPAEGEVLIGADADASLLNLIRAINHTGTADTDYSCAAAHTQVSAAASVTAHAFLVTALVKGVAANSYATTESSATLSWTGAVLAGGIDGTVGKRGDITSDGTNVFICLADGAITDSGKWKKFTIGSL